MTARCPLWLAPASAMAASARQSTARWRSDALPAKRNGRAAATAPAAKGTAAFNRRALIMPTSLGRDTASPPVPATATGETPEKGAASMMRMNPGLVCAAIMPAAIGAMAAAIPNSHAAGSSHAWRTPAAKLGSARSVSVNSVRE